jgi:hypothetical protein
MIRNLVILLSLLVFVISCDSSKPSISPSVPKSVRGDNDLSFKEAESHAGISVIVWSMKVTNTLDMSRAYAVRVEFFDRSGGSLFTDSNTIVLAPGETKIVTGKKAIPTETAAKIMSAKAHGETL